MIEIDRESEAFKLGRAAVVAGNISCPFGDASPEFVSWRAGLAESLPPELAKANAEAEAYRATIV